MKIACAWCGKYMGEKNGNGLRGITHSICEECLPKLEMKVANEISTKSEQVEDVQDK